MKKFMDSKAGKIIIAIAGVILLISLLKVLAPFLFLSGAFGIWYYSKKKPNKLYRNFAIAVTVVGFILVGLTNTTTENSSSSTPSSTTQKTPVLKSSKETEEEKKAAEEQKVKEEAEKKAAEEKKAKEEAEKKAAEEQKAKEEAEKKAAEEKKAKEEAEKKAAEEAAKAKVEAEKKDPTTYPTQPYDEMARNGDNHKGEKLQITGRVIQVQDSSDGGATLRVATNENGYDDVYLVQIAESEWKGHRLLEDDQITIYGLVYGLYTYETVLRSSKTLPAIIAVFY